MSDWIFADSENASAELEGLRAERNALQQRCEEAERQSHDYQLACDYQAHMANGLAARCAKLETALENIAARGSAHEFAGDLADIAREALAQTD